MFDHGLLLKVDDVLAIDQVVYRDLDRRTELLPDPLHEIESLGHGHLVSRWPQDLPQPFRGQEELCGKRACSLFGMEYDFSLVILIDDKVDLSLRRIEENVSELVREVDAVRPCIRATPAGAVQDGCGNAGLRFLQCEGIDPSAR